MKKSRLLPLIVAVLLTLSLTLGLFVPALAESEEPEKEKSLLFQLVELLRSIDWEHPEQFTLPEMDSPDWDELRDQLRSIASEEGLHSLVLFVAHQIQLMMSESADSMADVEQFIREFDADALREKMDSVLEASQSTIGQWKEDAAEWADGLGQAIEGYLERLGIH